MSSYRRFISYMHQYPNGKKGNNCGFVKIEIKNNLCSLWFQLKKVPSDEPVSLAFFIRENNTIALVPIWEGSCPSGMLSQRFTTDSLHLFNTNYSFRQCSGILLIQKNRVLCGGCWDASGNVPVHLPVVNRLQKKENMGDIKEKDGRAENDTYHTLENSCDKEITHKDTLVYNENVTLEKPSTANKKSIDSNIKTADTRIADAAITTAKNTSVQNNTTPSGENAHTSTTFSQTPYDIENSHSQAATSKDTSNNISENDSPDIPQNTTTKTSATKSENAEATPKSFPKPTPVHATDSTNTTHKKTPVEKENTPTFEELWNNMQKKYPPLSPFEEGGIVEGIKVSPSDLPYLQFLPFNLGANRFLLHGYKNYKHLLLGRMEGQNRYILGIPGVYDSQEQFMAKMFGFPCFKPIRSCMKPVGQFGYWFRCIKS